MVGILETSLVFNFQGSVLEEPHFARKHICLVFSHFPKSLFQVDNQYRCSMPLYLKSAEAL